MVSRVRVCRVLIGVSAVCTLLLSLSPASASSANISHSYDATGNVPNGSLVSLDPVRSNYVKTANSSNGDHLIGVAVASNDSLLAIDPSDGHVQVATSGTANALVSTVDGPIAVGDQVSVSPFDGIGMKASMGSEVIGLAQTAFSATSPGSRSQTVTDKSGKVKQISVGYVRLGIGISSSQDSDNSLTGLQRLSERLTGHTASTTRIVISLFIAVVALLTLVMLIYSSIYGGIISVGRNPLAKYAIFRTIASVFVMVLVIAGVATLTIFLLLY